ncbi:hypothetical protein B0H11DRAFT_1989806 [Mycena galericulata]|nr:hypothetical protein B0H11DRAFT_1989806 [Mycena galericulata]
MFDNEVLSKAGLRPWVRLRVARSVGMLLWPRASITGSVGLLMGNARGWCGFGSVLGGAVSPSPLLLGIQHTLCFSFSGHGHNDVCSVSRLHDSRIRIAAHDLGLQCVCCDFRDHFDFRESLPRSFCDLRVHRVRVGFHHRGLHRLCFDVHRAGLHRLGLDFRHHSLHRVLRIIDFRHHGFHYIHFYLHHRTFHCFCGFFLPWALFV